MPIRVPLLRPALRKVVQSVLLALIITASQAAPVAGQDTAERKRVLIFFSNDTTTRSQMVIEGALSSALKSNTTAEIEIYSEYIGEPRLLNEYENELIALIKRKYAGKKFDVIFTLRQSTSRLLMKVRSEIFPDTPIVFLAIDKRNSEGLYPNPGVTGVWGEIDFKSNLEIALGLHPGTRRVVVVSGVSETDQFWKSQARERFRQYENALEFTYLDGLSIPEMRRELAALPPSTIVFYTMNVRDKYGNTYESPDYLRQIASASTAPIYGTTDVQLGNGIVGGKLAGAEALGSEGGEMGARILAGENPEAIAPYAVPNRLIFDWRELKRWGISESNLPPGSVVRFKQPTLWEEYRWYLIGLISALVLETGLIGGLVILRSRRRKAELERNEFQRLAEAEQSRLQEIVRNVPGVVWETRIKGDPDDRETVFISDYVTELFGYDPEEYKAKPGLINELIVEDQREWFASEMRELITNGNERVLPFKIRTKGGMEKWVQGHVAVVRDESGASVGIRGVTMDITERKVIEERLAAKQLQLTEAQRLAQVGSWEWDERTGVVTWSDEIYHIYGRDPSQPAVAFEEHKQLLVPDSWERLGLEVENTLKTGEPYEIEIELIRADGHTGWGSARGELVIENDGSKKLRGTLQDISARRQAEESTRESEARFRTLADSAPVLIWMTDKSMEWTFFNKRVLEFTGLGVNELRGRGWLQLVHKEDRDRVIKEYSQANALVQAYKTEYRILDAHGNYRWLHDTGVPHFSPKNEFIGFIRSCTDVTELKSAVAAIRESEERFRHIADSAPVLIWISDAQGRNTFMNQFGLEYTGLSEDAVKGSGWLASLHKDDKNHLIEAYRDGHARQVPVVTEFRLRGADGGFRWFFSTSVPRNDENGKFLGFIGTCADIDDRKQAEGALQLALTEINQLKNKLQEENIYLKEEIKLIHDFEEIVGESEALKYVLFKIEQVAPTNATVLITGETGTGKELVARAVHSASYLKNRPLVKVNCAALAANFIESELFGHEKGSFTGATGKRIGRFELAQGGTIFLDEIGELPLDLQVKLLRVLQEGEFERLGSSKTIKVDVRVIAATNRDLRAEVEKGNFREDLLFRLNVFPITVPPLRERKDDIPLLVNYFVQRLCKRLGKKITSVAPGVVRTLMDHSWPGNIRELANVIERSVISTKGETLKSVEGMDSATASNGSGAVTATLEQVERDYISEILRSTDWKVEGKGGAAHILGLNPSTLRTRMQKLGIMRVSKKNNGS